MKHQRSARYLQFGLISFFLMLLICIVIRPIGLVANDGISYYGSFGNTLLPYSLAFLINSVLMWQAASVMDNETKADRYIVFGLKLFALLFIGILLTPHDMDIINEIHIIMGSVLFSLQLFTGIVLTLYIYRDWLNITLLTITLLSGVASLVYLLQQDGFMIQTQVIFQVSIWLIFIRSLQRFDHQLDK
jgi:hypothetical protein